MRKKRVLLLSEGFGTGHTQAAHALSMGLRLLSRHVETHVLELGAFLHPTLAPWIFTAYRKTVTVQPRLCGLMYRTHKKSLNRFTRLALHRIFYAQTAEILRQLQPDAIVCTHPFPNAVISRLKQAGLDIPLCTVVTDYDVHGTWVNPEVNKYLVSTQQVRSKLLQLGVPSDSIQVTGIPVHPNFWRSNSREKLRKRFGLKAMPTVLVMGGGWGLVRPDDFLPELFAWRDKVQFVICLGSNEKALTAMSNDERFRHENIRLIGFTKEIDKWMDTADLLITKPGGMTCTEALAKGIPMLFYSPIPGQEEENLHYFTQLGLGEPIQSKAAIDERLGRLASQEPGGNKLLRPSISSGHADDYKPTKCPLAVIELLNA